MTEPLQPAQLLAAAAIAFAAGIVKGTTGFGFPILAVPMIALFAGSRAAVILVTLPVLVTNVAFLLRRGLDRPLLRRFAPLLLAMVPTTVLGGLLLGRANASALSVVVGVVSVAFALISATRLALPVSPRAEPVVSVVLGAAGGLLYGTTSISGPFFITYLTALGLEKWAFIYALTLFFSVGNVMQVGTYAASGLYAGNVLLGSLLLCPAALLGQALGLRLMHILEPATFRRVVTGLVLLAGANLIVRGLTS